MFGKIRILLPTLIFALATLFVASCISVRTDYPEIKYYQIKQEAPTSSNRATVSGVLQVRGFTGAEAVSTDEILVTNSNHQIQKLYYHRWAAECPQMLTDYFVLRLNNLKAFSGGTINSSTMLVPDFILEGELLDMNAIGSSEDKNGNAENSVNITLRISLIKRSPGKIEKELVFNKTYNKKTKRTDNSAPSIAPAFAVACAGMFDDIMTDIQREVARYNLKEK
jgi:ABC-type uncharacterized transport system auxiliary subunit